MSKIFHCRCAVAIKFANKDNESEARIIAFDESHIDDVRVELSGFNSAVPTVAQNGLNPSFSASRYASQDSTVSVTLNETVLDAGWVSLLDVAYQPMGYKGIDFVNKNKVESIYDVNSGQLEEIIGRNGIKKVSDPEFNTDFAKKAILEAQGRALEPRTTQPQEQDFVRNIKDETSFKNAIKGTLKNLKEGETAKDERKISTQKDNLSRILTIGRKVGLEPEIAGAPAPSTRPQQQTSQPVPAPQEAKESYGKIVLLMDHTKRGGGAGADGKERTMTDEIAKELKKRIEAKEPKIKVEIVTPEDFNSPYRICDRSKNREGNGCKKDKDGCGLYDSDWDKYDQSIIDNYVNNINSKATIISIHLDAPPASGGSGGKGAAVWNLDNMTATSKKLSNILNGTYVSKFKVTKNQAKVNSIQTWDKCGNRGVRIFQNAPEGYALLEFGVFRAVEAQGAKAFITEQKEAFDALVDGLIQFKKSFGTSTSVPQNASNTSSTDSGQLKLQDIGPKPGILVSFWYDINGYISKVDYYFVITQASISFGDGVPKLSLYGNSAFSVIFNTWRIQDSFNAGTPVDEALRKIFNSDPTNTYNTNSVEFDTENPKERLFEQEDIAGLTYREFISKLARKFDLQYISGVRTDQIGKIKIFRETRGGLFNGSQVFWLGRGLFEKFDISVVYDLSGAATVGNPSSNYMNASNSGDEGAPGSPFLSSDRVEIIMQSNQPSMLFKVGGTQIVQSKLPPPGWERIQQNSRGGLTVNLKLPNGEIWPSSGDLKLHALAENRGSGWYGTQRSIIVWDSASKTFVVKTGYLHTATDGGLGPGRKLISYFKGKVIVSQAEDGYVSIKYNRWVRLKINGEEREYQLFHNMLHMSNRIPNGREVDVGTIIGTEAGIGKGGAQQYDSHMHEEFYINTPAGKTLYLDPFIVYNYSYSKDTSGNITFDSAARVGTVATGTNNPESSYVSGSKTGQGNTLVLRTEFKGIPRALQILPGQTFLHFVTDYNNYLTIADKDKYKVDPGIPIIRQLQDWMIVKCSFNWSGDLRLDITAHRPRTPENIYKGQNWQNYRLYPGKGPALDDYYDYIRSIGDLSYRTVDENGNVVSSFDTQLKNVEWMTGFSGGSSSSNPDGAQPTVITGRCKYTGSTYRQFTQNINTICAQLERAGLNKIAIAGILGNIKKESSFGEDLIGEGKCNSGTSRRATDERGRTVTLGPNDCWGIVQWGGGRREAALQASNLDGRNIAGQANFIVQELRNNEKNCACNNSCPERDKNLIDLLNNAKSAEDAARIFRICYERPGADDSQERQNEAKIIFQGLTCE